MDTETDSDTEIIQGRFLVSLVLQLGLNEYTFTYICGYSVLDGSQTRNP